MASAGIPAAVPGPSAAVPDVLGFLADVLAVLAVLGWLAGFLDASISVGGTSGVTPAASAASGRPGTVPDPRDVRDRVVRRFSGSSADLMIRAYVSVIRFSRSAV
jgi:hypothetical protein